MRSVLATCTIAVFMMAAGTGRPDTGIDVATGTSISRLTAAAVGTRTKVVVTPIVVEGTYAIAGWKAGESAGEALLQQSGHPARWRIIAFGGGSFTFGDEKRNAAWLTATYGVPRGVADRLIRDMGPR